MGTKRPKPVEIVVKLRQIEALMGQGMPRIEAISQISLTEQTYCRWKIEALKVDLVGEFQNPRLA